jgi:hypothetical protein
LHSARIVAPRLWSIVLHRHTDASFTARVWVDGKLLLPDCVGRSRGTVLSYLGEALIDARGDDRLAVRSQGCGAIESFPATDPESAKQWLMEQLRSDTHGEPDPGAESGTRPIVRADGAPVRDKASRSS